MTDEFVDIIDNVLEHLWHFIGAVFVITVIIAIVRSIRKAKRGENVEVAPVGYIEDLPSSITGINKYK